MTLGDLRKRFSRYAGAGNSFTDRANEVQERLLDMGNWKGTKDTARFVVYRDRIGNSIITLPPDYEAVLAGAYQAQTPDSNVPGTFWCGRPIPVRGDWYDTSPSGPGNLIGTDACQGIIPMNGRFTTFQDWATDRRMRVKLEEDESPGGTIIFRGKLVGRKIYTNGVEGVPLAFTNATVTTTSKLDEPPYQVIKPVTKGRLQIFAVDDDDVETLVAYYEPNETGPSYKRYKIPACSTGS